MDAMDAEEPRAFDTESFILFIKERPALWDLSSDGYSNRLLKKEMWEEVTMQHKHCKLSFCCSEGQHGMDPKPFSFASNISPIQMHNSNDLFDVHLGTEVYIKSRVASPVKSRIESRQKSLSRVASRVASR